MNFSAQPYPGLQLAYVNLYHLTVRMPRSTYCSRKTQPQIPMAWNLYWVSHFSPCGMAGASTVVAKSGSGCRDGCISWKRCNTCYDELASHVQKNKSCNMMFATIEPSLNNKKQKKKRTKKQVTQVTTHRTLFKHQNQGKRGGGNKRKTMLTGKKEEKQGEQNGNT